MNNADEVTFANGYTFGRPDGREALPLDKTIQRVIESLPYEVRLYPDIYAWKITDAVTSSLKEPR